MSVLTAVVAPGFFGNGAVRSALALGAVVAVVSAPVGVIAVLRRQSFAGHALGDVGATGGSGAFLVGVSPLWGFLVAALAAAGAMELAGNRGRRSRDVATGIVFGAALGLAALLLYLDTTGTTTSGAAVTVLFGSLFVVQPATLPVATALGVTALAVVAATFRPLLLAALHPDLAAARGVRVRLVGLAYLVALAVAVALSALTIGAVLSTALLIGPAATALRVTSRPGRAVGAAAAIGVGATWLGILLSYDSYAWPPATHGWPVSFFVVVLVLLAFVLADLAGRRRARRPVQG